MDQELRSPEMGKLRHCRRGQTISCRAVDQVPEKAPKSKVHIRTVMSLLIGCAIRWELLQLEKNPMSFVRIPDSSKKLSELPAAKLKQLGRKPRIRKYLSFEQVRAVLNDLQELFRTMAIVAACLGIRASEIAALQWNDFDWTESFVFIQRGIVAGTEDEVKTFASKATLPLDPALVEILQQHRNRWEKPGVAWVFSRFAERSPVFDALLHQFSRRHRQIFPRSCSA